MKKFKSKDPLTSFLYSLMRDYVPAGFVELIVKEMEKVSDGKQTETTFTNGHLAQYAQEMSERLKKLSDKRSKK